MPTAATDLKDIPAAHIPPPDDAKILTLPDGRKMGYGEYGDLNGRPFIFVHGIPDCRFDCAWLDADKAIAKRLGVRWIGIDRPGIGLSTPDPKRTILGWPEDVQHLISHLGLDTYHIFGVSGGTAYALACAKLLPRDKLRSVGIMCGMGPPASSSSGLSLANRVGLAAWNWWPGAMQSIINHSVVKKAQDPDRSQTEQMCRTQAKWAPAPDRELFQKEETIQLLTDIWREVYRQGSAAGHAQEMKLVADDWGFPLESVTHGKVRFWYGDKDVNTPLGQGQYMADRIPGATLTVFPGKSHFTVWDHIDKALEEMLQD